MFKVRALSVVVVGLMLCGSSVASAQAAVPAKPTSATAASATGDTPLPTAPSAPPVEKTFEGTAEVSAVVTNGNTKNQNTGLSIDATYRWTPWLMNLKSKYQSAVAKEVQTGESFEISGRGSRNLTDHDDIFLEHTYLKNRFAGVDNRNTTSLGVGHFWIKSDTQTLRNEIGLGYTSEERTDRNKLGFMSGLVGLLYKYKISPTADLTHETKYLPNFGNREDWRLTSETSLSAAISSMLSSKIAWKYEHVNLPPLGKVRGDTTTTVSLLAKF